jgi:hypothetical protein
MFQGGGSAPDRAVVAAQLSSGDVGIAADGPASNGRDKGGNSRDASGVGGVAEVIGSGGAFCVENELSRIQGELNALLMYAHVIPLYFAPFE